MAKTAASAANIGKKRKLDGAPSAHDATPNLTRKTSTKKQKITKGKDKATKESSYKHDHRAKIVPVLDESDDEDDGDDIAAEEEISNDSDGESAQSDDDSQSKKTATSTALTKGTVSEDAPTTDEAPEKASPSSFADLGLIDSLCEACESLGYKKPTEIQAESIPLALSNRDLIGLAETGSGKTAAFALPILQALINEPGNPVLYGLVMVPTRELAFQVSQQFEALGSLIGVRCAVIVGGMEMMPQQIALSKRPHIVVATPGRLMDHLENTKGFSLRTVKYVVMDEADRLLDLDFGPVLDKILKVLPRERRTYLFSATMSSKVESLQRASLRNPLRVSVSASDHQVVKTLVQTFAFVPHKHKDFYLVYLLNEFTGKTCIIFTRTVVETQRITLLIRALGFSAIPLHGQLPQSARLGALGKFRGGSRNILVATDVAARGLDIPSVDVVLNFDLPPDSKTYVHRVGRTARAGKSGKAVSLVTQYDVEIWMRIEKALGSEVPVEEMPKDEVLLLAERVGEAQRLATKEVQELQHGSRGRGRPRKGRRGRDEMDADDG